MWIVSIISKSDRGFFIMLKNGINGFCMALADSVPGVSGGTMMILLVYMVHLKPHLQISNQLTLTDARSMVQITMDIHQTIILTDINSFYILKL